MRWIGSIKPDVLATVVAAIAVGGVAALFATGFSIGAAVDATVHPVAMALLLVLCTLPLIRWAVDGDRALFLIVTGGLIAKGAGTYVRYTLTGNGDNRAYHAAGRQVATWLSEAIVGPNDLPGNFGDTGTDWLSYVVGWVYYATGPRRLTGFVVFTFLGFFGMLMFYRAAISAVPEIDKRRYAILLFYMPSMLFWPSTIGKEAWMICFLGMAALGASGLLRHRYSVGYLVAFGVGLAMVARVRPHMTALVLVAVLAALIWPTRGGNRGRQIVAVAAGLGILSVALGQVADYFGAESADLSPILDFAQARTSDGGSVFSPVRITGPFNLIPGAISVLFRPFLIEADNSFQLAGSIESLGLAVVALASHRRVRRVPRLFLDNGYIRFAVIFTLGFVIAFSVIANFGILTRQRAQLWPVFLVLFALMPKSDPETQTSSEASTSETADATR